MNLCQVKAVIYVKEKGQVTDKEYQEICNTSNRTASRDLANLVSSGLLEQIGITGKGTAYILRRHKNANCIINTMLGNYKRRQNILIIHAGGESSSTNLCDLTSEEIKTVEEFNEGK